MNRFEQPHSESKLGEGAPDWVREEIGRRQPMKDNTNKKVGAPAYIIQEMERRKKSEEAAKQLEKLKLRAKENPRAPFIFVDGEGFFEVPARVAAELSDVNLGFPIGLGSAKKAFDYLGEQGIISPEPQKEWMLVKWAGTAEEAISAAEKSWPPHF